MVSNMGRIENINEKINELNNEIDERKNNLYEYAEKEMDDIIQLLTLNKTTFDEKMFRERLNNYLKKYHRILYSCFSNKIYEWSETDNSCIDNANVNLTSMVNKIDIGNFKDDDAILLKLLDHMQLAIHQVETLKTTEENINPYLKIALKEVDERISKQAKKVKSIKSSVKKDIENQKDSLMSQMISIVSIFVGIAFVMFGGMSLINDLFTISKNGKLPVIELLCLGSLIGVIMIIVMYCFIMFILSVTNNKMLRAKKLFFRIVQTSCTILGFVSFGMFLIWCCQTFY